MSDGMEWLGIPAEDGILREECSGPRVVGDLDVFQQRDECELWEC